MHNAVKSIWIESEEKGSVIDGTISDDDNSDVIVTFNDNSRYIATFFTYANISRMRQHNERTGEFLNGKYFWASDLILIDKISRETIVAVIDYMLETNEFNHAFNPIQL